MFFLPNFLSFLRLFLAPLFLFLLFCGDTGILWATLVFTVGVFSDFYDGYFARKLGLVSELGNFLDPIADKVLVLSAFIAFYFLKIINFWVVAVVLGRDIIITILRLIIIFQGRKMVTSRTGKWKTTLQFILIYFVLCFIMFSSFARSELSDRIIGIISDYQLIYVLIYSVVIITVYSGIRYLIKNLFVFRRLFK